MVDFEELKLAYKISRENKRRSSDNIEYQLYVERNLTRLYNDIINRTLRPTAYTFVTMKPRPREVFASEMGMRVIHHYICLRMSPLLEKRLTSRTFNNRIGYGADAAVNQLAEDIFDVSEGFKKDAWIVSIDLKGYFPNAVQDVAYEQMSRVIIEDYEGADKDDLLYMLQVAIYSYPTHHCYRKSPLWKWYNFIEPEKSLFCKPDGIGAAIGHLIWQNGMNYYLNDFDHWVLDNVTPHYIRFVDDMYFVVGNKEAFLPMLETIRARLAEFGCTVHPKKFYCQHWNKGVNVLGNTIKVDRIYPSKRIVRNARKAVRNFNRCPRVSKIDQFVATINSYLGIFKRRNAYRLTQKLIGDINPKWWEYIEFDAERQSVHAKDKYRQFWRISRKYNLKYTNENGKNRKNRKPRPDACAA